MCNHIIATFKQIFREAGLNEITEALPGKKNIKYLDDSVACIYMEAGYEDLLKAFSMKKPVFLQHIFPGDKVRENFKFEDLSGFVESLFEKIEKTPPVHFQVRIKSERVSKVSILENLYDICREKGVSVTNTADDKYNTQIFSVYIADSFIAAGVSKGTDNISIYSGGKHWYKSGEDEISRAGHKLLEALDYFDIDIVKSSTALDLGASPGGWSKVMLEKGTHVTAVDPAKMSDFFTKVKNFKHEKMTAQEFLGKNPGDRFDFLLNDMKMDAKESARLVCGAKDALKPCGTGIITFKIPEKNPVRHMREAARILEKDFCIKGIKHLYNNRNEVTCVFTSSV